MVTVKKEGVIIQKTLHDFENEGVLNPASIKDGNNVHLFYRAVRNGNFSSIGYSKLAGPLHVENRNDTPIIIPEFDYESHGVEDPRIVKIDDLYYLSYTAFDGINALGALALSKDLITWDKQGVIVAQITYEQFVKFSKNDKPKSEKYFHYNRQKGVEKEDGGEVLLWDKNLVFFPRRINGMLCFLHRIKPDIQIVVAVKEIVALTADFWEDYFIGFEDTIVLGPKYKHESCYTGGGCPPIETEFGWLLIYHGVEHTAKGFVYSACASLLDLDNPQKEIARLPYPLFKPELSWELKGEVNNVCFPSGTALFGDRLYIYYGAADERVGCASVNQSELVKELMLNKINHA
ncbi:glycoside hydrolase family 130 protein [Flavobacterium caseinilyticum]|uniref:Pesticidal protein Cry7Aa n=1 Tax=Flavobacterium caseinilyticum TaxID=2541732 RepID=A0A4R5AS71_9FLAO|nr:pesticidal protein Cry7Aa [Flavobacterium caseinilyticum]TDD74649.1 pesticidal protein Cry7Aa [Flavobacterium caseinilyticum]